MLVRIYYILNEHDLSKDENQSFFRFLNRELLIRCVYNLNSLENFKFKGFMNFCFIFE